MSSVIILVVTCISFQVIHVKSWDLTPEYYNKDYDENKNCPNEERFSLLSSIQNENLDMDQCFDQPWGKGGQQ